MGGWGGGDSSYGVGFTIDTLDGKQGVRSHKVGQICDRILVLHVYSSSYSEKMLQAGVVTF